MNGGVQIFFNTSVRTPALIWILPPLDTTTPPKNRSVHSPFSRPFYPAHFLPRYPISSNDATLLASSAFSIAWSAFSVA